MSVRRRTGAFAFVAKRGDLFEEHVDAFRTRPLLFARELFCLNGKLKDTKCKKTVDTSGRQVIDENAVDVLSQSLQRVVTSGTGTSAAIGRPIELSFGGSYGTAKSVAHCNRRRGRNRLERLLHDPLAGGADRLLEEDVGDLGRVVGVVVAPGALQLIPSTIHVAAVVRNLGRQPVASSAALSSPAGALPCWSHAASPAAIAAAIRIVRMISPR